MAGPDAFPGLPGSPSLPCCFPLEFAAEEALLPDIDSLDRLICRPALFRDSATCWRCCRAPCDVSRAGDSSGEDAGRSLQCWSGLWPGLAGRVFEGGSEPGLAVGAAGEDGLLPGIAVGAAGGDGSLLGLAVGAAGEDGSLPGLAVGAAGGDGSLPGLAVGAAGEDGLLPGLAVGAAGADGSLPGLAVGAAGEDGSLPEDEAGGGVESDCFFGPQAARSSAAQTSRTRRMDRLMVMVVLMPIADDCHPCNLKCN